MIVGFTTDVMSEFGIYTSAYSFVSFASFVDFYYELFFRQLHQVTKSAVNRIVLGFRRWCTLSSIFLFVTTFLTVRKRSRIAYACYEATQNSIPLCSILSKSLGFATSSGSAWLLEALATQ